MFTKHKIIKHDDVGNCYELNIEGLRDEVVALTVVLAIDCVASRAASSNIVSLIKQPYSR